MTKQYEECQEPRGGLRGAEDACGPSQSKHSCPTKPALHTAMRCAVKCAALHGTLREAFACGTAAVIAPIGRFVHDGDELVIGDGRPGPVTMDLRRRLLDVQYGRAVDRHGWVRRVATTS